ncbi:MAG: metallophosphoesterase family protein [Desulfurococcaceae archaeon]
MVLIAHTSDLHLGVARFKDSPIRGAYLEVFEEIASKAIAAGAKYLLVAGDLFDEVSPPMEVVISAIKVVNKLKSAGVRVVVVPGNHDNSPSRRGVLDLLAETGLIHLARYREEGGVLYLEPLVFEDDMLVFYGLPGFRGSREVVYLRDGRVKFEDAKKYAGYDIVVLAHVSTKIYGYDPSLHFSRYGKISTDEGELSRAVPAGTKYVALGHVHIPLPQSDSFEARAAYPGAPIGMDINDLKETAQLAKKGVSRRFLLVDASKDPPLVKAVPLENSPKVVISEIKAGDSGELKKQVFKEVENALKLESKYRALLIYVKGLKNIEAEVDRELRYQAAKKGVHLELRTEAQETFESILLVLGEAYSEISLGKTSFEEIEERALKELAEKYKLGLPIDKLKWIINRLSSPTAKPSELLEELEKELL